LQGEGGVNPMVKRQLDHPLPSWGLIAVFLATIRYYSTHIRLSML